jgi:peptide/nickel transport system permease protein
MRSPLARYVLRRLLLAVPTVLAVIFLIFFAIDKAPGDPATAVLGNFATPEQRAAFAEANDLDAPVVVRYVRFLRQLAGGDLGSSLVRPEPVAHLVGSALPVTLQLTALAGVLAVLLATLLGAAAGYWHGTWIDRLVRAIASAGVSAPDFWIGILAIQLFAVTFKVLPAGGYVPIQQDPVGWFRSLITPAVVLAIPMSCALAGVLRAALADEMGKDYVRTARGAGLPERTVLLRYALPNSLLSPVTALGLRLGYLLSGAIVTEAVFNLPGLGTLLKLGVSQGDYGVVQGVAIVATVLFILVNLVVDLLQRVVSPRLREAS